MTNPRITRRNLLHGAAGAALLGALGPAISACSSSSGPAGPSGQGGTAGGVKLPTYREPKIVDPDLPAGKNGVLAGYYTFPTDPPRTVKGPVGSGGRVTALTQLFNQPFRSGAKNPLWQEVNRRLKIDLQLTAVPGQDYAQKIATTVAGDAIPDFMQLNYNTPKLDQVLRAKFVDLSQYLSGDAVEQFPNLAHIPTLSWESTVYNGAIYGLPVPRSAITLATFYRKDILEEMDLDPAVQDLEEFKKLCLDVTDRNKNRWALGNMAFFRFVSDSMGVPNSWIVDGDKLTNAIETEQFTETLAYCADLVKAGVLHPQAPDPNVNFKTLFEGGQVVMATDNNTAWPNYKGKAGAFVPPGNKGADPVVPLANGSLSLTAIPKSAQKRVEELLAVANFFAAPYGTEEYRLTHFGLEGTHWEAGPEGPVPADNAQQDTGWTVQYIADAPSVLTARGMPELVDEWHAWQVEVTKYGQSNPCRGLPSRTEDSQGAAEAQKQKDLWTGIVLGRQPVSAWADYVRTWSQGVGKQIKGEYRQALAEKDQG